MATYTGNSINELNQSVTGDSLSTGISNPLAVNDNLLTGSLSTSFFGSSSLSEIEDSSNSSFQNIGGSSSNSTTVIKSNPFAIVGNVVVGNGQWIINNETTPESVSSAFAASVDQLLDSVIVKLRNRLPLSDAGNGLSDSNPFANGNNPFGDGNQPSAPGLVLNASGENPFVSGENPVAGGENLVVSGENPFA
ncbi:hypothetical protein, partial [Tolypothrix sp. VBCCA 56010]|uniref:hypothetical protein n=1 Tax=Tolypothrix sp. VBCCA 56010 TaxID=3137731 RepID=UPI003D7CCD23